MNREADYYLLKLIKSFLDCKTVLQLKIQENPNNIVWVAEEINDIGFHNNVNYLMIEALVFELTEEVGYKWDESVQEVFSFNKEEEDEIK